MSHSTVIRYEGTGGTAGFSFISSISGSRAIGCLLYRLVSDLTALASPTERTSIPRKGLDSWSHDLAAPKREVGLCQSIIDFIHTVQFSKILGTASSISKTCNICCLLQITLYYSYNCSTFFTIVENKNTGHSWDGNSLRVILTFKYYLFFARRSWILNFLSFE